MLPSASLALANRTAVIVDNLVLSLVKRRKEIGND
jgi:hypothetical protein